MSIETARQLEEELKLIEEKLPPENIATRRIAIRSMFAAIEALCSAIASSARSHFPPPGPQTSHEGRHKYFLEMCALSEISYRIDEGGELKIKPPHIPFKNHVLFALTMQAKASAISLKPKEVPGWDDFSKAVEIRNRVTHPHSESDVTLSDADYQTTIRAFEWVVRCNHRACGGEAL